ncbi:MAG: DUF4339 domain-containing protein [Myxococcales bacterium]|nr:DUF4339 domain-containing protein [Myxococcales bacterium]
MGRDQTVWFAVIDGREAGPMTRGEFALRMASDLVDEETFVWKEGMAEWLPAAQVGELAAMFTAKVHAKKRDVRPPPPPAAALSKANRAAPVEEEIELEVASTDPPPEEEEEIELDVRPTDPPPRVEPEVAPPPKAAPQRLHDDSPVSTIVEMLPLGELIHQQQVAKSLFSSGEIPAVSARKTGTFALDQLKWAYAPTKKARLPQDAKAAALARAIQATAARPIEPVVQAPVTPSHPKTPSAGPRPRPAKKRAPAPAPFQAPRAMAIVVGFGAGLAVVLASAIVIWLLR